MKRYKHDYDNILTRLTTILRRLNEGESLSVKELANEFGVHPRTIQRDFNERLILFPIYQENKKWKMQKGCALEKVKTLEEEIILNILEKITESFGNEFSIKAKRLLSKIKNEDFNPIYTKLNIEDISGKIDSIKILENAIKDKKDVEYIYKNEKNSFKVKVSPLKIVNFDGFWYLVALDKNILKKYYLKNISNIQITNDSFSTDKDLDILLNNSISIWFQKDNEPFEVRLLSKKWATKYLKRKPLPTQTIISVTKDDDMEFSIKITHEMEIIPIVKYWIPHLKVLEPKWIADMIKNDVKEYIKNI